MKFAIILFVQNTSICLAEMVNVAIGMVKELTGGYKIKYHANGLDKDPIEIDFTPPFRCVYCTSRSHIALLQTLNWNIWNNLCAGCFTCCRRIDMIEELEKMANLNIPKDLSGDEANKYLKDACMKLEIKCPPPETTARLLDKVSLIYLWLVVKHQEPLLRC